MRRKSLLCSMFHEQTCSRFTRLFGRSSPCPKSLLNLIMLYFFWKKPGSKDINTDIPNCQIHKYKFTKTQKHKYILWGSARNIQHMLYFYRWWFKDIKNDIPKCPKWSDLRSDPRSCCNDLQWMGENLNGLSENWTKVGDLHWFTMAELEIKRFSL